MTGNKGEKAGVLLSQIPRSTGLAGFLALFDKLGYRAHDSAPADVEES